MTDHGATMAKPWSETMTHPIRTLSIGATLILACAAWSGGAAAQPAPPPGPMGFSESVSYTHLDVYKRQDPPRR